MMEAKTLYYAAEKIAGVILEDDDAKETLLSDRIERAADWVNLGTDGDLTAGDRRRLREIAKRARELGL